MGLEMFLKCDSVELCDRVNDLDDPEESWLASENIAVYWRKANMVHGWFVANVQGGSDDQGEYPVSVLDLAVLHDECKRVLDSTGLVKKKVSTGLRKKDGVLEEVFVERSRLEDDSIARKLLPVRDGFFFGSQEYDIWYLLDVQRTKDKLAAVLDCLAPEGDGAAVKGFPGRKVKFTYRSSW